MRQKQMSGLFIASFLIMVCAGFTPISGVFFKGV